MRTHQILIYLLTFLLSFESSAQKLTKPVAFSKDTGYYTNPLWSPNGKYIICTGEHSYGIYLLTLKDRTIKQLNRIKGAGYGYAWSPDSKKVYFKEIPQGGYASQAVVKSVDIVTLQIEIHTEINHNAIQSTVNAESNSDPIVYTNLKNLKINAQTLDGTSQWEVTKEDGQYYNAILSPDKEYVVVHRNEKILLYSIKGGNAIRELGLGIATSWSPDGKFVLSFLDESPDGHQVTNSDLYIVSVLDGKRRKLTNTISGFEMKASFSPNGKKIVYADDNSGKIFICKIK